ncbi:DUF551 domain-containing protein [Acinetobacter soli]|uniref:DUF551 domain-containing protein n=1 Tax=Acinetobacter soli TaxID=487316 RepID=UPI003D6D6ED3
MTELQVKNCEICDKGWVSVLVKEPPIDQTVLISWSDSPDVEPEKDYMTVDEDLNHYWANFHKDNPSHWMPLPKPPVKEAEGG